MKAKKIKWKRYMTLAILLILILNIGNIARIFYPVRYMNHVKKYATAYEVDPYLIMSIIKAESNFDTDAVSHKNAAGLMQIMEPTALWLADRMKLSDFQYENITDPETNIQMGCYYIAYLLNLYHGNVKNALAAYNAGEGNVSRWLGDAECSKDGETLFYIPFPETRRYITRVTNNQQMYRMLYRIRPESSLPVSSTTEE